MNHWEQHILRCPGCGVGVYADPCSALGNLTRADPRCQDCKVAAGDEIRWTAAHLLAIAAMQTAAAAEGRTLSESEARDIIARQQGLGRYRPDLQPDPARELGEQLLEQVQDRQQRQAAEDQRFVAAENARLKTVADLVASDSLTDALPPPPGGDPDVS